MVVAVRVAVGGLFASAIVLAIRAAERNVGSEVAGLEAALQFVGAVNESAKSEGNAIVHFFQGVVREVGVEHVVGAADGAVAVDFFEIKDNGVVLAVLCYTLSAVTRNGVGHIIGEDVAESS